MIQNFVYETGNLNDIEKVLRVLVPIAFSENGKYTQLHIKTKMQYWNDGKDHNSYWQNQPKIMRLSTDESVMLKTDRTYSGVVVMEIAERFKTLDQAAKAACKEGEKFNPKATRLFVLSLGDYCDDYDENKDIKCLSSDLMIRDSMRIAKEFDKNRLVEELGSGYTNWFNEDDGDVKPGWRLHHEPNGAWDRLVLSLVHIYYGK